MSTLAPFQLMRLEATYLATAPYMLHGKHNVAGFAMVDEINAQLRDQDLSSDPVRSQAVLDAYPHANHYGIALAQDMIELPFEAAKPGVVVVDFATDSDAFRDILAREGALQQVLSQVKGWLGEGMKGCYRLTDTNGAEVGFAIHGASDDDLPKQPGSRMRFSIDANRTFQFGLEQMIPRDETLDQAWANTLFYIENAIYVELKDADAGSRKKYEDSKAAVGAPLLVEIEFDSWAFAPPVFSAEQIEQLAERALHAAIDLIQSERGLTPGTVASEQDKAFFATPVGDAIQAHLRDFIQSMQMPVGLEAAIKAPSLMIDDDLVNMAYALDEGMVFGIYSDDKKMDGNKVYAICLDNYRPGHQESGEIFVVNADGIAAADGGGDAMVIEIEDDDLYELGPDERQSLRDVANGRKLADSHDVDFAMLAQPNGTELN